MRISRTAATSVLAIVCGLLSTPVVAQGHHAKGESHGEGHGMVPSPNDEPTLSVKVSPSSGLIVGEKTNLTITLQSKDGKPVTLDGLREAHTEKIHLLVVDPSLSDYHHVHPTQTATPGSYAFSFTPKRGGEYKVFADLVPTATGDQEYATTAVTVSGPGSDVATTTNNEVTVEGYKVAITFEKPELTAGEANLMTLGINGPDGKPFNGLEPIMGAYAHLVAFSEDRTSIAHIHPMSGEPSSDSDRGGPRLQFQLQFTEAGYHKMFAQFHIGGKDIFAPFGLDVKPAKAAVGTHEPGNDIKLVNNTKCPISGEAVGSMEEDAHVDYKGYRVGLCCPGCVDKFLKDGEANLKKVLAEAPVAIRSEFTAPSSQ